MGRRPAAPAAPVVEQYRPQLRGRRVLLADDNEINRQVAAELLAGVGVEAVMARNGRQAVELLKGSAGKIDAVLMDLQMPEMDGYEATGIIRATFTRDQLPIIAMTAHAMETEKQRGLGLGMNDYLTKPVDPVRLLATLVRWLVPGSRHPFESAPPASGPEPEGRPTLDLAGALAKLENNQALLLKVMTQFGEQIPAVAEQVGAALAAGNRPRALALLHRSKGSAGYFSPALIELTERLEQAVQADQRAYPERLLAQWQEQVRALLAEVTRYLADTKE